MEKKKKRPTMWTNDPEVLELLKRIKSEPNRKLNKLGEYLRSGRGLNLIVDEKDMKYILR